jgi:hypothetical protein
MGGRSESDYQEVAFEREGREPLHGFVRVDRGMAIVRGYGGHKETRVSSSAPDFIARLLLSEVGEGLAQRSRPESRRKRTEWKLSASVAPNDGSARHIAKLRVIFKPPFHSAANICKC